MLTQQQIKERENELYIQCLIKFIINALQFLSGIVTSYFFSLVLTAGADLI